MESIIVFPPKLCPGAQVFILDSLAGYTARDAKDAESIVERVTPRLQHANCAVVLSAVKARPNGLRAPAGRARARACVTGRALAPQRPAGAGRTRALPGSLQTRTGVAPRASVRTPGGRARASGLRRSARARATRRRRARAGGAEADGHDRGPGTARGADEEDGAAAGHAAERRAGDPVRGAAQHQPHCAAVPADPEPRGQGAALCVRRAARRARLRAAPVPPSVLRMRAHTHGEAALPARREGITRCSAPPARCSEAPAAPRGVAACGVRVRVEGPAARRSSSASTTTRFTSRWRSWRS